MDTTNPKVDVEVKASFSHKVPVGVSLLAHSTLTSTQLDTRMHAFTALRKTLHRVFSVDTPCVAPPQGCTDRH
ncbi:hypothetical protein JVU11DRAFT_10867 [Chiua virens]|nr:hypothetical protein JVU11DRAFT_10867 [Chiua virens]